MTTELGKMWTYINTHEELNRGIIFDMCNRVEDEAATMINEQSKRAIRAEAERDELKRAIMRLPTPPREMGDGPDERVVNILAEVKRLRAFVTVYDAWATDGDVFGDPFDAMVETRAALDASVEKEQTK